MPKLDLDAIPQTKATGYPAPYDAEVQGRWYRRLGPVAGLTHLGASHVVLKPDAFSSQRHWHRQKDELLVMLAGEAVLIEDTGEYPDIDMVFDAEGYAHKDGTRYPTERIP